MDILDIDEVLKDDSFCFLEDKTQDDVSNILQQWRNNGNGDQGTRLDTRTFTRPKRKSAQNLEMHFANASSKPSILTHSNGDSINLQIGGLVTNMQRSFLQDTSPPNSNCSSIDLSSADRMNSSLITSADFTNVSFFKTSNVEDILLDAQINGYSLDDVIKDRKALESLTLSGDSTIIKDSNIAQTDELSFISKTNSSNSTMCNSTDSMQCGQNETYTPLNDTIIENYINGASSHLPYENSINDRKFSISSQDLIINTTFDLASSKIGLEDSIAESNLTFAKEKSNIFSNQTFDKDNNQSLINNETFEKIPAQTDFNKTYEFSKDTDNINRTMDNTEELIINNRENCCATPDNELNDSRSGNDPLQSTPHQPNSMKSKSIINPNTPSIKSVVSEVNISPIVPGKETQLEHPSKEIISNAGKICNKTMEGFELYLDKISNDYTNTNERTKSECQRRSLDEFERFENEALSSAKSEEEEFDNLLENIGKSVISEECLKMRESLDYIKKRYSLAIDKPNSNTTKINNELKTDKSKVLNDTVAMCSVSPSGSHERLLSRRSRLYDDIKLIPSEKPSTSPASDDNSKINEKTETKISDNKESEDLKTETTPSSLAGNHEKSPEKRQDRERFKTIRIIRRQDGNHLNIPCIDDNDEKNNTEEIIHQDNPAIEEMRFSRREKNSPPVFNNNKSEVQDNKYSTYKKPKETIQKNETAPHLTTTGPSLGNNENGKQRSLSRPRYISGIYNNKQENNQVLPKANSATDLEKTATKTNGTRKPSNLGTIPKPQLKSPMGTKAKSFHNIAGLYGFSSKFGSNKPSSQPSLPQAVKGTSDEKEKTTNNIARTQRMSSIGRPMTARSLPDGVEKSDAPPPFKVPLPISNLRAPNSRRTGLVRPSSGYYSYNVPKNESDSESGRYSPNNSLSSASSRGSTQEINRKFTNGQLSDENIVEKVKEETAAAAENIPNGGGSCAKNAGVKPSIPKPSGLRPPSKRSGLPRPSSIVRR